MKTLACLLVVLFVAEGMFLQKEKPSADPAQASGKRPAVVLDINQATEEDFAKLPGVGPELARRIVAHRRKHGPYRRVEDLLAIRGIGLKKWRALRPYLRVGAKTEKGKAPPGGVQIR